VVGADGHHPTDDEQQRQVKLIFFNDPQLISEGLTQSLSNHDDHLHVRFYERGVSSTYSR